MDAKLCPFCGGKDIGVKDTAGKNQCFAYCRHCQARGPAILKKTNASDNDIIDVAYEAWNDRKMSIRKRLNRK